MDLLAADDEDLPGDVRGDVECRHYGLLRDAAVFISVSTARIAGALTLR